MLLQLASSSNADSSLKMKVNSPAFNYKDDERLNIGAYRMVDGSEIGNELSTISTDQISDDSYFSILIERWHEERSATSFVMEMARCPSYQEIINMGEKAIPLIFRQMESEGEDPDHWFWALSILTSSDPVPDDIRGNRPAMAKAWLDWGSSRYEW